MSKLLSVFTIRDYVFGGIIILLGVLLLTRGCHKDDNVITVLPVLRPTTQKVDNNGNTYTEIKGTIYTQAQMKAITDSIQKALGKGKVTQVTQTVTRIDTFLKQDTMYVDPATGYIYVADSQKDVQLSYTGNWKLDTGSFHMKLTPDTATSVTTIKKHLLRADELTLNEYHTNSLFIPSEGYVYTAKVPKVIAVVGPVVGGGITSSGKWEAFAGLGLTFNLFSIKSRK